jgi:hypothetical protein
MIFDIEDAMSNYDVRSEYSAQLGEALAISADGAVFAEMALLCNLLVAADENIVGLGTATVLNVGTAAALLDVEARGKAILKGLTTARARLTANYVPASDRRFFCSPTDYSAILSALMPATSNYAALIDPETGSIKNVMGFEITEVPHLTIGGAGDNLANLNQKHVFPVTASAVNKVALNNVIGLFCHRSAVGTVKLKDLALERARRPEFQADQIIGKYAMGHGGLRPEAMGALVFTP